MNSGIRILHLEDNQEDSELVIRELRKSGLEFEIRWVMEEQTFRDALSDFNPDVILSDHSLPGFDSVQALQIVRTLGLHIPFILVTATVSEEFAVSVLKQGAEDYILKDRLQRLPDAVKGAVEKYRNQQTANDRLGQIIRNEKRFRGMIENTSDLIGMFDANFKMKYRSPNYERIIGWSTDELERMSGLDTVHPDDLEYARALMKEVLHTPGKIFPASYRLMHKDGSYRMVEGVVINLLHDESISGIVSNLRDVTEIRKSAHELRLAHERLMFHLENSPLGFVEWDNSMQMKSWSSRAQEIFGWQIGEFRAQGRNVYQEIYEGDREWVTERLKDLLTGAVDRNTFQCRNTTKSGTVIWCEWFNSVLRDGNGKVLTIMSLVQNITERKLADEMLMKSQANLAAIIENTDAFIYSIDRDLRYITFNKRLQDVIHLTYGIDLHPGMTVYTLLGSELDVKEWEEIYRKVLAGETLQFVKDYSTRAQPVFVSFSLHPIYEQGTVKGVSCFSRDITAQYLAEEERRNMVQQLMRQNNDLLQFSFIAAHNLRGPVASVLGVIQAMDQQDISRSTADLLPYLNRAATNLDNVVRDMTEIVNIRAGEIKSKEVVNIVDIIQSTRQLLEGHLEAGGVRYLLSEIEVVRFYTVRLYFNSILYNLISNAVKFRSHKRTPEIEIKTYRKDGYIYITVRDNGVGINLQRFNDKVFGLYNRFHPEVEGKGMGLYMVKTQVETLNGTIDVQSIPDEGTIFTIRFREALVAVPSKI